jgi:hypothetical protein
MTVLTVFGKDKSVRVVRIPGKTNNHFKGDDKSKDYFTVTTSEVDKLAKDLEGLNYFSHTWQSH